MPIPAFPNLFVFVSLRFQSLHFAKSWKFQMRNVQILSISHFRVQYHSMTQFITFFGRNYPLQGLQNAGIGKFRDTNAGIRIAGIKMQGLNKGLPSIGKHFQATKIRIFVFTSVLLKTRLRYIKVIFAFYIKTRFVSMSKKNTQGSKVGRLRICQLWKFKLNRRGKKKNNQ